MCFFLGKAGTVRTCPQPNVPLTRVTRVVPGVLEDLAQDGELFDVDSILGVVLNAGFVRIALGKH